MHDVTEVSRFKITEFKEIVEKSYSSFMRIKGEVRLGEVRLG